MLRETRGASWHPVNWSEGLDVVSWPHAAAAQARPQITHPPGEIITNRTDIQTDKTTIAATWRQVFLLLTPLYKNKKSWHSTDTEKTIASPDNLAHSVHQTDTSKELS